MNKTEIIAYVKLYGTYTACNENDEGTEGPEGPQCYWRLGELFTDGTNLYIKRMEEYFRQTEAGYDRLAQGGV